MPQLPNVYFGLFDGGHLLVPSSGLSPPTPDDDTVPHLAVLEFSQANVGHVRCGQFWLPPTATYGDFFWEWWFKAADLQTVGGSQVPGYLVSDGYGGKHVLLIGFSQQSVGAPLSFTGNVWNGSSGTPFASDEGPVPGEWCHVAYAWGADPVAGGAKALFCYLNGVCVGKTTFAGPRKSGSVISDGCTDLFVMGSNHDNLTGRLAMARAFEGFNPFTYPQQAFCPENGFAPSAYYNGTFTDCQWLMSFMQVSPSLPDMSPQGFDAGDGIKRHHPGALYSCGPEATGSTSRGYPAVAPSYFPRPQWVYDDTCPCGSAALTVPTLDVPAVSPCPVGARIFDGFDRTQQSYVWQYVPSLGSTDSRASLGALAWVQHGFTSTGVGEPLAGAFGIRAGRATPLAQTLGTTAIVDNASATQDVRCSRIVGTHGVDMTAVVFRFQDRDNFWCVYTLPETAGGTVRIAGIVGGSWTLPASGYDFSTAAVSNWTRLRVVANGTTLTVYIGIVSGGTDANGFPLYTWTQVGQLTSQTQFQSATKVGICGIPYNGNQISSMIRYDNFEVQ